MSENARRAALYARVSTHDKQNPAMQLAEATGIMALWCVEKVHLSCGRKVRRTPRFGLNNSGMT
jgi:hypothetical protein